MSQLFIQMKKLKVMMNRLNQFVRKTSINGLSCSCSKNGEADAIFSAGNTGALLASGLFIIGRIKQVERPGLMTTMPVFTGEKNAGFDFIDMGANADNKAEHLLTYGILGSFYAKKLDILIILKLLF